MALTIDGSTVLPQMGNSGSGVGLGAVGGGVAGLVLGSLLGNRNGGGLFGGNGNGNGDGSGVAYDALQTQIQTLQGQVAHNSLEAEMESMENTFATITSGQTAANATNFSAISRQIEGIQTAEAAANYTNLVNINGLGRDIVASNTQALINSLQNFNQLQNSQQTATNLIIAGQNTAAAALASCCCDLKQAIAYDGSATRALISDLNVQNLRDQLAASNNKVSNNEQNQYLLNTILTHIKPTCSSAII